MNKNFKNDFALFSISLLLYALISSISITMSNMIKVPNSITAVSYVVFAIILIIFLKKKNRLSYYGLNSLKKLNVKNLLYFIPMIIIVSMNLWTGINIIDSLLQIILITI